jgi:F0F1-type ATP synthase assembly protein I
MVWWQLTGITILACLAFFLTDMVNAYSVFLGGMAYGLPNLIFVWRVFRLVKASEMSAFLFAFMVGEMLKLLLCGILVLLIVNTCQLVYYP